MSSPLAVVTGASSGIGKAMALQLSAQGVRVLAVARRQVVLDELAGSAAATGGAEITALAADLTTAEGVDAVAAGVRRLGGLALLVNVAGTISLGPFLDQDPKRSQQQIRLNCEALVMLTSLLLPIMIESGGGRVLNVASVAGTMPTPLMAVYGATKAFVISFSEALGEEMRGQGVSVTAYCPGPVDTPIYEVGAPGRPRRAPRHEVSPEQAASAGLAAANARRSVVVPGLKNKLNVWSARLTPRPLLLRVLAAQRLGFLGFTREAFAPATATNRRIDGE